MTCHAPCLNLRKGVNALNPLQDGDATASPHQESWDPQEAIWAGLWPPSGPETGGEWDAQHGMCRALCDTIFAWTCTTADIPSRWKNYRKFLCCMLRMCCHHRLHAPTLNALRCGCR